MLKGPRKTKRSPLVVSITRGGEIRNGRRPVPFPGARLPCLGHEAAGPVVEADGTSREPGCVYRRITRSNCKFLQGGKRIWQRPSERT